MDTEDFAGRNYAAPLYDALGPEGFAIVAEWLRIVADLSTLEVLDVPGGRLAETKVPWLAEVVTFYDPNVDR